MPIYSAPDGSKLVVPRVLARTEMVLRHVVALPDGFTIDDAPENNDQGELDRTESPERKAGRERRNTIRKAYWKDFLDGLELDDPDQALPSPSRGGHVVFKFGAPGGTSWLKIYRDARANTVGVFLSGNINSIGEKAHRSLASQATEIQAELGDETIVQFGEEKPDISDEFSVSDLESTDGRVTSIEWLQERTNAFVNVLRPRIKRALRDMREG